MIVFYALSGVSIVGLILLGPNMSNLISFGAGILFGILNFLLTVKFSSKILFKKGVANPRALIVIKLLFLVVGLSALTTLFQDSLEWVTGGVILSLFLTITYFVGIQTGVKK